MSSYVLDIQFDFLHACVPFDSSMFDPHSKHVINKEYNDVTDFCKNFFIIY